MRIAFFALCFIFSMICTAPLAVYIDANGIAPLASPLFMTGISAMVISLIALSTALFKVKA